MNTHDIISKNRFKDLAYTQLLTEREWEFNNNGMKKPNMKKKRKKKKKKKIEINIKCQFDRINI
mgnify:CR=1 FL=1